MPMTTVVSSCREFSFGVLYGLVLCTELPNVLCSRLGGIYIIDSGQKTLIREQRKNVFNDRIKIKNHLSRCEPKATSERENRTRKITKTIPRNLHQFSVGDA